ncbi:MAG TPA: ATP-binding protein [Solirubrobacteraceae bacterium]|jgi:anti-sigma regulatory factor (Ser/Thr protein kinase)
MGLQRSTESVLYSFPALPASVPEARNVVASLAARHGASWDDLERIRLVVSEAVTNAVVHAYDEEVGNVHLTAAVISGDLTVVVSDDGCGWGCAGPSPGLGLGLGLVANACQALSIVARPYGGTQLEMRLTLCAREREHVVSRPAAQAEASLFSFEGR